MAPFGHRTRCSRPDWLAAISHGSDAQPIDWAAPKLHSSKGFREAAGSSPSQSSARFSCHISHTPGNWSGCQACAHRLDVLSQSAGCRLAWSPFAGLLHAKVTLLKLTSLVLGMSHLLHGHVLMDPAFVTCNVHYMLKPAIFRDQVEFWSLGQGGGWNGSR